MAEKISSDDLAQQLGVWFREAGNLVTKSGGTIDKFIGDAMLAYWSECGEGGSRIAPRRSRSRAISSRSRATTKWANGEPFHVGIALHYGSVTCGNVGLDAQRDATIIGDVVNTVFRLESVMKELNQQVLLSADFGDRLPAKRKTGRPGRAKIKATRPSSAMW